MQSKKLQQLVCILFCGFLAVMTVLYLCLPKADFSQQEKRYLAKTPELSWKQLSDGSFATAVDSYMADHIPGRDFFVGLNAYYELLTGRQGSKDVLVAGDNRIVEAPVTENPAAVTKNMEIINRFAESAGVPVDLMIVPSAGWAAEESISGWHAPYSDPEIIAGAYAQCCGSLNPVDMVSVFSATGQSEALYYKTDHHWTSAGAYTAYEAYMAVTGQIARSRDSFTVEQIPGFRGSTYSRSALWLTPGESIELWHGSGAITVSHMESETSHNGIFFRERLAEADKYTVFLDGNHSLVRIHNPEAQNKGSILVIRDSFGNSLGGFLAESYETVVLADLRYYRHPLSELMAQEQFDRVLICYSIGNFLTDTNIVWLR